MKYPETVEYAHDERAEASVIAAMLIDPNCMAEVRKIVTTHEMFFSGIHSAAFEAIMDIDSIEGREGMLEFRARMLKVSGLDSDGFDSYCNEIVNINPSPVGARVFANDVRDCFVRRRMVEILDETVRNVGVFDDGRHMAARVAADTEALLVMSDQEPETWREILQRTETAILSDEQEVVFPTHFHDLDRILSGGLRPGQFIVVAARPSMGKTALAQNIAENMAMGGAPRAALSAPAPVVIFSLEMSSGELTMRAISRWSRVSMSQLRSVGGVPMDIIHPAVELLEKSPFHIVDDMESSVEWIRAKAKQMVRSLGVGCIFIDYLQLMTDPQTAKNGRYQEISSITRQLKNLARLLRVPLVCLSQLNRQVESQKEKRPRLKDLRDSGTIEQDADVVIFLHRDDYYDSPDWRDTSVKDAEAIVAKQRNGPCGMVKLLWDPVCVSFESAYLGHA